MRKLWTLALLCLAASCASPPTRSSEESAAYFHRVKEQFIDSHRAVRPPAGAAMPGDEARVQPGFWGCQSLQSEEGRLERFEYWMEGIPTVGLPMEQQVERAVLLSATRKALWHFYARVYWNDPAMYADALGGAIDTLLDESAPAVERETATAQLRQAGAIFGAARINLDGSLAAPKVELAVARALGHAERLERMEERAVPAATRKEASEELRRFAAWLRTERAADIRVAYAVGRRAFQELLDAEMIPATPEEVLLLAMTELREERARFIELARAIEPEGDPLGVLREVRQGREAGDRGEAAIRTRAPVSLGFHSEALVGGWEQYLRRRALEEESAEAASAEGRTAARRALLESQAALLDLSRLVSSVKMHCQGMTLEEGARVFVDHAHLEEEAARAEALLSACEPERGLATLGCLEIQAMREAWRLQEGGAFTDARFEARLLSYGSPPLGMLRRLMLEHQTARHVAW